MEQVLLDEVVHDYGQFDLLWSDGAIGFDGDSNRLVQGQVNGLVGAGVGERVHVSLEYGLTCR